MFAGFSQIDPVLQLALYDFLLVRQPDFLSSNAEVLQVPTALSARTVRNEAAGSVFLLTSPPSVYSTSRLPLTAEQNQKAFSKIPPASDFNKLWLPGAVNHSRFYLLCSSGHTTTTLPTLRDLISLNTF